FGLATGVAVATKLSAVPYIGLGILVLLISREFVLAVPTTQGWPRRLAGIPLLLLAAIIPIFIAYGRRSVDLTGLPHRFEWVLGYLFPGGSAAHPQVYATVRSWVLPEACWDFAEGVIALTAHNNTGHLSYLLGRLQVGGWWYFYLVALAVKTPL